MSLSTTINLQLRAALAKALDLATAEAQANYSKALTLATGTGANQADKIFHDQRTLTASASENLDLAGVLVDALGDTITFARIKAIIIVAAAANVNNVLVGGAASNGFINWVSDPTDVIVVRPGGVFLLVAPDTTAYAVTASTGDILKITNSAGGTSVIYDVILIGASA